MVYALYEYLDLQNFKEFCSEERFFSSFWCLGQAALFYCGTQWTFNIPYSLYLALSVLS